MKNFFVDTYKKRPLIISKSKGSYLITDNGDKYLDFLSGISINNIGYAQ
jgi:acetylornithine/N-succinyldiaminopimelate aminotransferase